MGAAVLLLHVALAVPPGALPPATVAYAVAEAAVIWAPYGVIVDAAGPCDPIAGDAMLVTVAIVNTTSRVSPRTAIQKKGRRGPALEYRRQRNRDARSVNLNGDDRPRLARPPPVDIDHRVEHLVDILAVLQE